MIGRRLPIQYYIMLLTTFLMSLVLLLTVYFAAKNIEAEIQTATAKQAMDLAHLLAQDSFVQTAMESANPSERLQPFAEHWRLTTGASFVVIANMQQIRITHPLVENIGTPLTDLYRDPVLHGEDYLYIGKGSLDPSLRANAPIFSPDGSRQIGLVSIGFSLETMHEQIIKQIVHLFPGMVAALLLCILGSIFVSRKIKQTIYGLEPYQIAALAQERKATLAAIHEGLISVDAAAKVMLMNHEAAEIFAVSPEEAVGCSFTLFIPEHSLNDVISSGKAVYNQEYRVNGTIIVGNSVPIFIDGRVEGAVFTFRDRTEISHMAEEMTGVHRFVDILRAQNHEFKNKLHAVSGLIQLGCYEEAVDFIIDSTTNQQSEFEKLRSQIKDSVTFGLLLGKCSRAQELGVTLTIDETTNLGILPEEITGGDLVIILGNLLENAFEAVQNQSKRAVRVKLTDQEGWLTIEVENNGPPIDDSLGCRIFERGVSTRGPDRGLGLALVEEKVKIHGGTIDYQNQVSGGVLFSVHMPTE